MVQDSASRDELALLLERIEDPRLRADISAHVELLRRSRRFGLVFDRHLPEAARLPKMKPRAGDRVARRDESDRSTWRVLGYTDRTHHRVRLQPLTWAGNQWAAVGESVDLPTRDVVVVRDHGESIHPGLVEYDRVHRAGDGVPTHVAIEGENLHALQLLKATHGPAAGDGRHGLVDLIYIDPPYNTGNKSWIYNDRYVDEKDQSKSSKWLSFMERRLRAAKPLLKETGVVLVAIGDQEHHRLRMLMDQIFGADNFISDVVWQGGRKNDSRFVSNGADYMLIYGRNSSSWAVEGIKATDAPNVHELESREIQDRGANWRPAKPGVEEVLEQGGRAWEEANGDMEAATALMRAWFRKQPKESPVKKMSRYVYFLPDGRLCRDADISWPGGGGPDYDVLHPDTGKPVPVPDSGWRYTTPERMQQAIDDGWIVFRDDHTKPISLKNPLDEVTGQVALSVFDRQRTHGSRVLYQPKSKTGVFRDKRFPNPKDPEVLKRWIGMATPRDAVILDFFAGSGSTLHAVLRLNAEDGGSRQCLLVTNNELAHTDATALRKAGHYPGDDEFEARGVFRHVANPRIRTVVTGVREDGSVYDGHGLAANVAFYTLTQLDPGRVRRGHEFAAIAPILWMQAGGVGPVIEIESSDLAVTDTYAVLFDTGERRAFIRQVSDGRPRTVFVVTDSPAAFRDISGSLPPNVRAFQLYESYLTNFEVNTTRLEA